MPEPTRRNVLQLTGVLAAAGAGGLAGCSQLPLVGGSSTPGYASWLTAPDELETDQDHYQFGYLQPTAIAEFESDLADQVVSSLDTEIPVPGIDTFGDAEQYLFTGEAAAFTGGFERADVVDALESNGYREEDTVSGYTLYEGEGGHAVAVGDERVVESGMTSVSEDPTAAVETAIETDGGSVERYQSAEAAVGDLLTTLGEDHLVVGSGHDDDDAGFEQAVASGLATTFGADETEIRAAVVFEEGEADDGDVEDWAEEADDFFGGDVETSTSGRTVVASTTVDTGDVTELPATVPETAASRADPAEPTDRTPTASFTFDYEETTDGRGVVTVTHDGGDSIPAGELYLRGTGFADVDGVDQTEAGQWQGTASGDRNEVLSGDRVTLGVTSDYEIDVIYQSADGSASSTLMSDTGPDA